MRLPLWLPLTLWLLGPKVWALEVPGPLVEVPWLARHLQAVVVLDIREQPGRFAADGHIPGAAVLGWGQVQAERRENGVALSGMVPSAERFTTLMQRRGIDDGEPVVITGPGKTLLDTTYMARLYWTLKYYGHDNVAVLDGGTAQWRESGQPLGFEPAATGQGDFAAAPRPELLATTAQVAAAVGDGSVQRVDVRSLGYYLGLFREPSVESRGHIPGAKLYPYTLALRRGPVRFRPREELKALAGAFGVDPERPIFVYCNTGVLSAAGWFIFHELLGSGQARLYDGSMHAWARTGHPSEVMQINLE